MTNSDFKIIMETLRRRKEAIENLLVFFTLDDPRAKAFKGEWFSIEDYVDMLVKSEGKF